MAGVTAFYPRPTVPAVVGICPGGPMGWRIPSVEDWDTLMGTLGNFPSKVLQRYGNACTGVACYRLCRAVGMCAWRTLQPHSDRHICVGR